jgi:hypothetical protein
VAKRQGGAGDLNFGGTFNNPGRITAFTGGTINVQTFDATLKGGGQVALPDFADDDFINVPTSLTLTNVDNTISGAGGLQGLGTLINQAGGTINANLPAIAPLHILLPVKNSGLMEATVSGAALIIENNVDNTGGGVIKAFDSASVEFVSAVIVGGTLIQVNKGATIGLDDDTTLDGTGTHPVTISGNYVTVGRLNLEGTINAGGKTTLDGSFGNVLAVQAVGTSTSVTLQGKGVIGLTRGAPIEAAVRRSRSSMSTTQSKATGPLAVPASSSTIR